MQTVETAGFMYVIVSYIASPVERSQKISLNQRDWKCKCHTRRYLASRRVDIECDRFVGIVGLEPKELRDNRRRRSVINGPVKTYYPFLRQSEHVLLHGQNE
jgi:hypothetical protein